MVEWPGSTWSLSDFLRASYKARPTAASLPWPGCSRNTGLPSPDGVPVGSGFQPAAGLLPGVSPQARRTPAKSRRLEFLHFGTDFLTVPPRVDQAEAHALYQGMASAVPLEAVNSGL